ncbi:hypothetical protein PAMC26510_33240 [Caballeronia sordidicola]|uniref:Uncharacterized protein n=1 Tax=Caballeronia sordidicola TaxID=196367 RepID=A0A242M6I1_CABSO|nr:hypothetical protein PAMC26510_33240 [Caballeronia sordidicola]
MQNASLSVSTGRDQEQVACLLSIALSSKIGAHPARGLPATELSTATSFVHH